MLEYAKQVLPKVCGWEDLFRKELIKCIEWSDPAKRNEIYKWCYQNYGRLHADVLEEVFQNKMRKPPESGRIKNTKTTTATTSVCRHPDFVNTNKI